MRRRIVAAVIGVLLVLGLAAGAFAKELKEVKVCGAVACVVVTDVGTMHKLADATEGSKAPPRASEYYSVSVSVDAGERLHTWHVYYVPSAGLVRAIDEHGAAATRAAVRQATAVWMSVPAATRAAFGQATAGLAPFPKPALTSVRVGARPVTGDPSSYLSLYEVGARYSGSTWKATWHRITLQSETPSPWTDGANKLSYSPNLRLIRRDGHVFRIAKSLSDRLRHGAPLR
ncbi:MAG: hypothetical protein H0U03_08640 [Actinobacteria bacterium]|nr:hypothetical protein [Actinomycetota bacterium]